jgi:hypothetical protein
MYATVNIRKWLLPLCIVFVFIHSLIDISSGEEFPWPMVMGAIARGSRNICPGVWNGPDTGTYESRVAKFKAYYCKSDAWEAWMLANKARYASAFAASKALPGNITISFRYETASINYSPPWASEAEHMSIFTTMANGTYPNYHFNFVFNGNTSTSYANIIAGTANTTSYVLGRNVYLYYETIFNHEFAHVMQLPHHYDSVAEVGLGRHMPPGESQCIMDRSSSLLCSACRTALNIPLDISDTTAMDAAVADILSRYPY